MTEISKISLRNLQKRFGEKVVLNGVDLDIAPGDSMVVIGSSGTGKSVMLKCILGLLKPDGGTIQLDGNDIGTLRQRERNALLRHVGMLFQGGALFDSLPVWENVSFGLLGAGGISRRDAKDHAIETLAKVELDAPTADLYPAELSGGMQKRVGLARAIAASPDIIFFDEPTTGLDPITADVINNLILERVQELGATTLTITHDMASVRKIASRVAMLHDGKIIWSGNASDIDRSDNPYLNQFIHGEAIGPMRPDVSTTMPKETY